MSKDYKALKFERRGKLLTATMDNPPLNSASPLLHDEPYYVFYDIARDPECSAVVLTGAGRTFSTARAFGDTEYHLERYERLKVEAA
jgi:enoyl-CoA hydratase